MNELKKKVSNSVKIFIDSVIEEADEAEQEERYFNKGIVSKAVNSLHNELDMAFIDFAERLKQNKGRVF